MKFKVFLFILFLISLNSFAQKKPTTYYQRKPEVFANNKPETLAQIKPVVLTAKDLPKSLTPKGKLLKAVKYRDLLGFQLIIASRFDTTKRITGENSADENTSEICVKHYRMVNGVLNQNWAVTEYKSDTYDFTLDFNNDIFTITDLNNNGKGEVWISCSLIVGMVKGELKTIMYEDSIKHTMTGTLRSEIGSGMMQGGEFRFDKAFTTTNKEIKNYAITRWNKINGIK